MNKLLLLFFFGLCCAFIQAKESVKPVTGIKGIETEVRGIQPQVVPTRTITPIGIEPMVPANASQVNHSILRKIPENAQYAYLEKINFPLVTLGNGKSRLLRTLTLGFVNKPVVMELSSTVRILDDHNLWVTQGQIYRFQNRLIGFHVSQNNQKIPLIDMVWILSPAEEQTILEKLKASK